MSFEYDFQNTTIHVVGTTTITAQELIDSIRVTEATVSGIAYAKIADATGKQTLAEGVLVGITIDLQNGWQIAFPSGAYTATIKDGNLVGGPGGDPVQYSPGVQVVMIQSAAATIVQTGGSSLTQEEHDALLALPSDADVADAVWDELLTGASHNISTSAGKRLQQLGNVVDGAVNDVSATTTRFISNLASTYSGFYNDQTIRFTSGNLEGQARIILDYDNVTQAIVVDEPWSVAPTNGDDFEVIPEHVHPVPQIVEEIPSGVWTYIDRTLTQAITASGGGLTQEEHDHLIGLDTSGIATIETQITSLQTSVEDALGIGGENVIWSSMTFDSNHNLTSARITQYTDNTLSVSRKAWQLTATYNANSELTSYQLVEV